MNDMIKADMPEMVVQLGQNVEAFSKYLVQMAGVIQTMQARLDEMEKNQRAVTVSHAEVKGIQQMIRVHASDFADKYFLPDVKPVRNAMKKDLLKRYNVKDLHDLPVSAMTQIMNYLDHYANIRLVIDQTNRTV